MTQLLKISLVLNIIGYILYLLASLTGNINYPSGFGVSVIVFVVVTFGLLVNYAILGSIIELRERFLDGSTVNSYQPSKGYVPPTFPKANQNGSFNILQSGGSLIEEHQMNQGWTCECGMKNPSGTKTCIHCGNRPR